MKLKHLLFLLLLNYLPTLLLAQQKPILVYDLVNNTLDTIPIAPYDTTILSDRTPFNIGQFNDNIQVLAQTPPTNNVYENSRYTYKKRAADDFDLNSYPIRTSIKLFRDINNTLTANCSGSMISRRHVLTATHCVIEMGTDSIQVDSINVCPVLNNGVLSANFDCSYVEKVYFFQGWSILSEDFAILELAQPIGDQTGWISMGFETIDSILLENIYYKFSYPGITYLSIDSNEYNGDTLYYGYGSLLSAANTHILYENNIRIPHTDGIPGESGSSITAIKNGQQYTTYGVLTWSNDLEHSRITNWKFYALATIIENDLEIPPDPREAGYPPPKSVVVYPNPTSGLLWFKHIEPPDKINVSMFNNWGSKVFSVANHDPTLPINISAFANGIYHLKITTAHSIKIIKVIKGEG